MERDSLLELATGDPLSTRWLGKPSHYVPSLGSSNDTLTEMAARGAPAGTMVITDYQQAGKGRLNRRWEAATGSSLLFSLLFRPHWSADHAVWLVMIAGLAAAEAIESETDLTVGLKWPNDIMIRFDEGWRKCGGILVESSVEEGEVRQAIVGMGINVNMEKEQVPEVSIPAVSLQMALDHPVPRLPLLDGILKKFERYYEIADAGQSPHRSWNERLVGRGSPVVVRSNNRRVSGVLEGTDRWGRLLIRRDDGEQQAIPAGDVTLRSEK